MRSNAPFVKDEKHQIRTHYLRFGPLPSTFHTLKSSESGTTLYQKHTS
jgi:hypothetical protein